MSQPDRFKDCQGGSFVGSYGEGLRGTEKLRQLNAEERHAKKQQGEDWRRKEHTVNLGSTDTYRGQ